MDLKRKGLSAVFLGAAMLLTGCVNLAGANISNIGNGNSADIKTGDINAGNGNNVGQPQPGNNNPQFPNSGPNYTGVKFNQDFFRLRRLPANANLGNLQYDANSKVFTSNFFNPNPQPSAFTLDLGAPADCLVQARASFSDGNSNIVNRDQSDWEWRLPPGIEIASISLMGPYEGMPMLLVAKGDLAACAQEIRLVFKRDEKVFATASVEVADEGGADVVME
ncbi:MAG TPA: hypothetical protein DD435_14700 [Cyanobacteria bacterium UBA8530]|nr:hypothetical protein [Cyanobacteria bacterium UBA8530]